MIKYVHQNRFFMHWKQLFLIKNYTIHLLGNNIDLLPSENISINKTPELFHIYLSYLQASYQHL